MTLPGDGGGVDGDGGEDQPLHCWQDGRASATGLDIANMAGVVLKKIAARDARSRSVLSNPSLLAALLAPVGPEAHSFSMAPRALLDIADVLAWFAGASAGRQRVREPDFHASNVP